MCHYSRPWRSSDPEVIFPFLFWFFYKWIEVWSDSQYCAALKTKADYSFLHLYPYTLTHIHVRSYILSLFSFDMIFNADCFFSYLCWFSLPPDPIYIGLLLSPACNSWWHTRLYSSILIICTDIWEPEDHYLKQIMIIK